MISAVVILELFQTSISVIFNEGLLAPCKTFFWCQLLPINSSCTLGPDNNGLNKSQLQYTFIFLQKVILTFLSSSTEIRLPNKVL